ADAGDVRSGRMARGLDLEHGLERPVARRAPRAVGAGKEPRLQLRKLLPGRTQLLHAFGRLGGKELEAESRRMFPLRFHVSARKRGWERASARSAPARAPCGGRSRRPDP